MTNITPTIKMLRNVGEDMVFEVKVPSGTIGSSADTIDISGLSAVASGDSLKILNATNITDGNAIVQYLTYTKSTRTFKVDGGVSGTNVDTVISGDELRIECSTVST